MSQGVTLAKGSFSKDFAERLTDYYRFADPDGRYAERKLRQWEGDGARRPVRGKKGIQSGRMGRVQARQQHH